MKEQNPQIKNVPPSNFENKVGVTKPINIVVIKFIKTPNPTPFYGKISEIYSQVIGP